MIGSYLTSIVRTLAGYLVGWLVSLPFAPPLERSLGVDSATAKVQMTGLFVFILGTIYYAAARAIENRWPRAGLLLGIPAKPVYGGLATRSPAQPDLVAQALALGIRLRTETDDGDMVQTLYPGGPPLGS